MLGKPKTVVWVLGVVIGLSLLATPVAAIENSYAEDVESLEDRLDDVAQRYSENENVSGDLKAFIQEDWEDVEFHEALETTDIQAYGAVWIEINELRNAIESDASAEEVADQTEDVKAALRNGLDALDGDGAGARNHSGEGDSVAATVDRIRADLDVAAAEYAAGERDEAKEVIGETYLSNFEGLEGDLIEKDPDLVTELEIDFNAELPGLMNQGASVDAVGAKVEEMNGRLDRVEQLLGEDESDAQVFGAKNRQETRGVAAPAPGLALALAAFAAALVIRRRR